MSSNAFDAVVWSPVWRRCPYLNARPFHFPGTSLWGVVSWTSSLSRTGSRALSWPRLDGCVAEDFSKVLGFSTDLIVQLVTKERRLPVDLFARA